MSEANPAQKARDLNQLPPEKLVEIIVAQQTQIEQLHQEIERLKGSLNLDSQTSSKPPSSDLLKKSEKAKNQTDSQNQSEKRRPGGQPGHKGKTRKGLAMGRPLLHHRSRNLPHLWQPRSEPGSYQSRDSASRATSRTTDRNR